jgi:hypothetical protein
LFLYLGKTYIMKDIKSGLNPFSSENLPTFIIALIVMGVILIIGVLIQKFLIPRLNTENRFVKWWKNNIIDEDPDHL